MKNNINLNQLDILAFAKNGSELSGEYALDAFARLKEEDVRERATDTVHWRLRGEQIKPEDGENQIWLHLNANTKIMLTCQRCLTPANFDLEVSRKFRFVANEQVALAQDDENEEDLLVLDRKFNALELIEDELIMSLPIVPRHPSCQNAYLESLAAENAESTEFERPNPFAVLEQLKKPTNH
jgi:uncharacterized protein